MPDVELVIPTQGSTSRQSVQLKGTAIDDSSIQVRWNPKEAAEIAEQGRVLQAGIRELWLTSLSKGREVVNFAANPPAQEGDLRRIEKRDLEDRLDPLNYQFRTIADSLEANPFSTAASQQNLLLAILVILLLAEQALAYWASYHLPPRTANAPNQSGVAA